MKVALIGASGFVGSAILNELLQRGHHVAAIARNPEKIKHAENVSAIKANVLNESEVEKAVKGQEAVISAYNAGWTNPNLYDEYLKGGSGYSGRREEIRDKAVHCGRWSRKFIHSRWCATFRNATIS